jgi:hypothetical protein
VAKPRSTPAYNPFAELEHVRNEKHSGVQMSESPDVETLRRPAKSQNPNFVKLTAYVPRELHHATKVRLVQNGKELSQLVEELLSTWLEKETSRTL